MAAAPVLRWATLDDLDALRQVYRRSSLSNAGDRELLLAHPDALVLADIGVRDQRTRVAVVDMQVVGFATLDDHDPAELEDLFVDPDWMRRGIATALVEDAAALARTRGVTHIDVTANEHARRFYEWVGFVSIGVATTELRPAAPRMRLTL